MNHDNKPLTVDQMREMHDKVVIVKTLEYGQESKGILDFSDPNDSDNGVYVGCGFYSVESYGFFWLAYAQKPIDFDAWKPCEKCRSCFSCAHVVESINDSKHACFWCEHMDKFKPLNFCSNCGRPLTDEAKQMLERRLAGQNNEQ